MSLDQILSITDLVKFEHKAHASFERNPSLRTALANWLKYLNTRFELTVLLSKQQLGQGLPPASPQFKDDIKTALHGYINRMYEVIRALYGTERE